MKSVKLLLQLTVVILLCISSLFSKTLKFKPKHWRHDKVDPEVYMNVTQLITSKGYPCEQHNIQTADGYILGVQRIPHGKSGPGVANRPVILLQHGLLSCSSCWVENPEKESLGFLLADAGMDVWLGNNRGNTYSRKHIKYTPSDKEFWAFSYDEMAKYDLPAMVSYIIATSNSSQIYYAGHSQGTMQAFAGFSQNQDLGKKVKMFFALAPVATVKYIESPIRLLAPLAGGVQRLFDVFGVYDFMPSSEFTKRLLRGICEPTLGDIVCENVLFVLGGFDFRQMNQSRIPVYVAEHPAGTSVQNIVHFSQGVIGGQFQMFDYGSAQNMQHYNQTTPPLYHVSQMNTPVVLFTGSRDFLADPTDVNNLKSNLTSVVYQKDIKEYEHLDFIWGIDAASQIYLELIHLIKKQENIN